MIELLNNIWAVYLDTAIWLLLGLVAAGFVKVYIPEDAMTRWLGGTGFSAVGRAALFGAPLPLCSCGVLPAALGLRRAGASKEATVSFLISTPETSIDSVAVTYALMGPFMAIYRPVSALVSAMVTGLMVAFVDEPPKPVNTAEKKTACCNTAEQATSCCSTEPAVESCSSESSCCETKPVEANRLLQAFKFAGADLLDDISTWLAFGIVVAGIMLTVIPDGWLAQWGQGLMAMLVMLVVGIPLYICAVASTPVAVGLLVAGVSPGAVLVFLLVGPATNIAGLMLVRQELGNKVTLVYLAGIAVISVLMGLLLDALLQYYQLEIDPSVHAEHSLIPYELSFASAILLLVLAVPAIRNKLFSMFTKK